MRKYIGKQSVLDEALGEFKDYGFDLVEVDDHITELYFKDNRIAMYNQNKVTFEAIRQGCANYLKSISNWK